MTLFDIPVATLAGTPTTLSEYAGHPLLIVNVASKCGLTPQYEGLQALHEKYADRGLRILGFPCNQFMGQEPGTADEIQAFCSTNYSVTFPLFEKIEVNGADQHPLYALLEQTADGEGKAGDVAWNFEKFLVEADGSVSHRFRPQTEPQAPEVVAAVEAALGASAA
jgi:glutathione peroxidase